MTMSSRMRDSSAAYLDRLAHAQPSAVDIDADAVAALLDDASAEHVELHSFSIFRKGHVAVEAYRWPYRPDLPRMIHSVTKSFTACGIGFAIAEGLIAKTDKVVSFFPEYLPPVVDSKLAAMTVEDLLTMRTGHKDETSGSRWRGLKTSWIKEFFRIPVEYQPGSVYVYTSAASYMLSAILTRVTGQTLHAYLKPRLFEPLGIEGELWDLGPDGINSGGNGLTCKTIDLLKFGILHAQDGVWEGRRILPEGWVQEATRPFGDSEYGYHWVTGPDGEFYALGLFGQVVAVLPKFDAVVVITSAIGGSMPCTGRLLPLFHRHAAAIFGGAATESKVADERLAARIKAMGAVEQLQSMVPPGPEHIGRHDYEIFGNPLGISRMTLNLSPDVCTLVLTDATGEHSIVVGIDYWLDGKTDMPGTELHHGYALLQARVLAGARWLDADTLEMTWIFVDSAFRDTVLLRFGDDSCSMSRSVNINSGPTRLPELQGKRRTSSDAGSTR